MTSRTRDSFDAGLLTWQVLLCSEVCQQAGDVKELNWVVVSNIFLFSPHPYLGKWSNLTNIFQLGWNHQLEAEVAQSLLYR